MPSLPGVVRRLRGSTSAVDLDTEAGRAFLQERVALFNKVSFLISGGFLLAGVALGPLYVLPGRTGPDWQPGALHAATLLVSLGAWRLCRRRVTLPPRVLAGVDAAGLCLPLLGFSLQALYVPPLWATKMSQTFVLIFTNMGISRAVLVPSSAGRTLRVTGLAAVPVAAAIATLPAPPGLSAPLALVDRFWSLLWILCALVVATLASHVIYGLREEVEKARRLGQYTLLEKLGEGGMGTVYRARHAMLRRPTAVKLLPPEKAGRVALERFEREVQITASLSHPNTVSVFDFGRTPDGIFYYAMEYLDGLNLAELVREDGPQGPGRIVHLLGQVASALVEAHGVGLIHRDIKPENVILCERGGVPDVAKVVDFGLVKDLEQASAALTRADVVQGTPLYLAPEAINAPSAVGPRSDLYALGAVGYYLVCGRPVFEGATLVEVCSHHLRTPPVPPSERLGRAVHAGLEGLILGCLEKDPARRPASAAELRRALLSLEGFPPWADEEARAWWTGWRERRRQRRPDAPSPSSATLSVAFENRETPVRD
jgi:tRNA A-37 threonylcarbamoyl transferase component Bud32